MAAVTSEQLCIQDLEIPSSWSSSYSEKYVTLRDLGTNVL